MPISPLPLVLSGPILRRVEPNTVTVWVALRDAATVTLDVYWFGPVLTGLPVTGLSASAATVRLGARLHVVAVTANANRDVLEPGKLYGYDLSVAGNSILIEPQLGPDVMLSYGDLPVPTFCLPPTALTDLRLVHASCRKPHGPYIDALPALDQMIEAAATTPLRRPHQLFLTGDQIYSDDVADVLLKVIEELIPVLFEGWREEQGWSENMVPTGALRLDASQRPVLDVGPGRRRTLVEQYGNLTPGKASRSHLILFAEFCTMYLLAWSPALWPAKLPNESETYGTFDFEEPLADTLAAYFEQRKQVQLYRSGLPRVRRALANIPTYMMFDDHEVTDDWFINRAWCKDVLSRDLGHRIVRNGILTYALFQGWGNRPWDYDRTGPNPPAGGKILNWLEIMCNALSANEREQAGWEISALLGLPKNKISTTWNAYAAALDDQRILPRTPGVIEFHYAVRGPDYEVLVLDTRTRRQYDGWPKAPPALLSLEALIDQVPWGSSEKQITFVISPAPVLGVEWIDEAQLAVSRKTVGLVTALAADPEAWAGKEGALLKLLARLAVRGSPVPGGGICNRVIFLSGDVHYANATSCRLWGRQVLTGDREFADVNASFVQFTSSASKNQQPGWLRSALEWAGYRILPDPALTTRWAIWNNPGASLVVLGVEENMVSSDAPYVKRSYAEPGRWVANWHQLLRITFIRETPIDEAPEADRRTRDPELLNELLSSGSHHRLYRDKRSAELILFNNIGEITIVEDDGELIAIQDLWWKLEEETEGGTVRRLYPYTRYRVPLTAPLQEPPPIA